ncbi:hypothetical protein LCGC14_3044980, partial [marine sediment metagenome]
GDDALALAEEIAINQKDAVAMVRLWEPKLQRLARFVQGEASKLQKEKVYVTQGEQPPLGVRVEEGPRGGHYYESEGIPRGAYQTFREDPQEVTAWAEERADPTPEPQEAMPDFGDFGGDVDALFDWANDEFRDTEELDEFFARAWTTEVTEAEITRVTVEDDRIELAVKLTDPETNSHLGTMVRTFHKSGGVHHDMFALNRNVQGQGIALAVNRQAEESYREMGFSGISLQADISIGKYAWAQQGYNFLDESEQDSAWESLIRFAWETREADIQRDNAQERYEEEVRAIPSSMEDETEEERVEAREHAKWERDELLSGIESGPTEEFIEEMMENYYEGSDAWDLAALDDGEKYGEY